MNFDEYQKESRKTWVGVGGIHPLTYFTLGIAGETGEFVDKIKKVWRDDGNIMSDEKRDEVVRELGDVLWYIAQISTELGVSLDEVAAKNIEKIFDRKDRGVLGGDGDNR